MTQFADRFRANQLLNLARSVMRVQRSDLVGTWPRASAILGRQALEVALDQFWARAAPGVEGAPRRAQMICLSEYSDAELARRVRYAWHGLSNACHHHAYDLPPIEPELSGWLDDVEALIHAVTKRN